MSGIEGGRPAGTGVAMPLPRGESAPVPASRPGKGRGWRLFKWAAALGLAWLLIAAPPPIWYRLAMPRETAFMAMQERWTGEAAEAIPDRRKYQPVRLEAVAPVMRRAVMIAEDNRFYEHAGFDWVEVRRAIGYPRDLFEWDNPRHRRDLWRAIRATARGGGQVRGASTLTQQLAKNLYLSPSRNPLRKIKEVVLAKRIEWAMPKDRILELYLNVAEFGPGIWGVEAASQEYFRKPASRLSRSEAAALAGLLPFPRSSNPSYRPGRMRARQAIILQRLR